MNKDYLKNFHANFFLELFSLIHEKQFPHLIRTYEKDQPIEMANDQCTQVGFVLNGNVQIEEVLRSGKKNVINNLNQFDIFGEILLFSSNPYYPYDIIAISQCEILLINKEILLKIFKEDINILEKFLYHISHSYMNLNKFAKLQTQKNIQSKLAYYFIYYNQISYDNLVCKIQTKTHLAELLGVERQSLIRELNRLKLNHYLDYDRNNIYILDFSYFKTLIE